MLFDTHVHFDGICEMADVASVVERARGNGVAGIIAVGGSEHGNEFAVSVAEQFPDTVCGAAIGFDRSQAENMGADSSGMASVASRINTLNGRSVLAIGEIGLDFHHDSGSADKQVELFRVQLATARELKKPVIVHSRNADNITVTELNEHVCLWKGRKDGVGVLHCFTGEIEFALCLLNMGFYIGISGIVTFPNAEKLRETVCIIPDDRLLIETDSPYLAPVPYRGQRNEPAYVGKVAETLARVRGCSVEKIAEITSGNAARLFGLGCGEKICD